jgi:hypothetical protein
MIRVDRRIGGMTCQACPSQWEFKTDDGTYLYIRYRHGFFSASLGDTVDDAVSSFGVTVLEKALEDEADGGWMTTAEMEALLEDHVEFYGDPSNEWEGTV